MRNSFRLIGIVMTLVVVMMPQRLFAWGQEGHRIVAEIAYRNLNCCARHKIDKVLGKHGIVYWANWPDELRSDTIYPGSMVWHYQDMDGGMTDEQVLATLTDYPDPNSGMLWRKTDSLINVLRHNPKDVDALRFVIHLTGDRFCPMHTAHLDDKGGNDVKMRWHGGMTNLHSVWDAKIIEARGYSYTEYVEYLINTYGSEKKAIKAMSREEITLRNYHTVASIYDYQSTWNGNPYVYVYQWHSTVEWNLYAAGITLAKILNELY